MFLLSFNDMYAIEGLLAQIWKAGLWVLSDSLHSYLDINRWSNTLTSDHFNKNVWLSINMINMTHILMTAIIWKPSFMNCYRKKKSVTKLPIKKQDDFVFISSVSVFFFCFVCFFGHYQFCRDRIKMLIGDPFNKPHHSYVSD